MNRQVKFEIEVLKKKIKVDFSLSSREEVLASPRYYDIRKLVCYFWDCKKNPNYQKLAWENFGVEMY